MDQLRLADHVRIERQGRVTRMYVDGEPFPWMTSRNVTKVITDEGYGLVSVTLGIVANSAEFVEIPETADDEG